MPTSDPAVPAFPPGGMRMSEAPVPAGAPDDPNVTIIRDFIGALDGGTATARVSCWGRR
jgi:hypothetical protein